AQGQAQRRLAGLEAQGHRRDLQRGGVRRQRPRQQRRQGQRQPGENRSGHVVPLFYRLERQRGGDDGTVQVGGRQLLRQDAAVDDEGLLRAGADAAEAVGAAVAAVAPHRGERRIAVQLVQQPVVV